MHDFFFCKVDFEKKSANNKKALDLHIFHGAKSLMCMFSSEVRCLIFVQDLHLLKGDSSFESKEV